ncbi:MAG: ERF family protein [Myxococcota bacterium]
MATNPHITNFPANSTVVEFPTNGRPLARKMSEVLSEVRRVPKNGRNDFHKYDYVTEADLVDHIRDKLAEKSIAIFPSVTEHTVEPLKDARNRVTYLTTVSLDVTLIDGESGDAMTTTWIGQGLDHADKGYYKAYTGAIKYFLLKTFLISTGDDPELEEAPHTLHDHGPASSRQRALDTPKSSKERWRARVDELDALLEEAVDAQQKEAFRTLYVSFMDAKAMEEIDAAKIGSMCRKLRSMNADTRSTYIEGVIEEHLARTQGEQSEGAAE